MQTNKKRTRYKHTDMKHTCHTHTNRKHTLNAHKKNEAHTLHSSKKCIRTQMKSAQATHTRNAHAARTQIRNTRTQVRNMHTHVVAGKVAALESSATGALLTPQRNAYHATAAAQCVSRERPRNAMHQPTCVLT